MNFLQQLYVKSFVSTFQLWANCEHMIVGSGDDDILRPVDQ